MIQKYQNVPVLLELQYKYKIILGTISFGESSRVIWQAGFAREFDMFIFGLVTVQFIKGKLWEKDECKLI